MVIKQNGNIVLTRWYSGSSYIKEVTGTDTTQYTFLGGDAYNAPVLAVEAQRKHNILCPAARLLGSITQILIQPITLFPNTVLMPGAEAQSFRLELQPGRPAPLMAGRGLYRP
jgi:hypothetical protein